MGIPPTPDSAGNFYGTTLFGGIAPGHDGFGAVFKLDKTRTETVLHSFTGGADGSGIAVRLIRDTTGNLYGAAGGGASGFGVVVQTRYDRHGNGTLQLYRGSRRGVRRRPAARLSRQSLWHY